MVGRVGSGLVDLSTREWVCVGITAVWALVAMWVLIVSYKRGKKIDRLNRDGIALRQEHDLTLRHESSLQEQVDGLTDTVSDLREALREAKQDSPYVDKEPEIGDRVEFTCKPLKLRGVLTGAIESTQGQLGLMSGEGLQLWVKLSDLKVLK